MCRGSGLWAEQCETAREKGFRRWITSRLIKFLETLGRKLIPRGFTSDPLNRRHRALSNWLLTSTPTRRRKHFPRFLRSTHSRSHFLFFFPLHHHFRAGNHTRSGFPSDGAAGSIHSMGNDLKIFSRRWWRRAERKEIKWLLSRVLSSERIEKSESIFSAESRSSQQRGEKGLARWK